MKPALLFLVHRIPFPPNKGDKIRSFNMIKQLSKNFDIHLACFIDDADDLGFDKELLRYCKSIKCIQQNKLFCKVKGLQGFITHQAITLPYYKSAEMQKWVDASIAEHDIQRILIFSAAMAQFVEPHLNKVTHSVLDFVDVDSDKWRQYAAEKKGIKAWFYKRESRLLQQYEVNMAKQFDYSTFVSDDEANLFKTLIQPELQAEFENRILGVRNGVDTTYFSPQASYDPVEDIPANSVVFTGAMDYWANANAVLWFAEHVWPLVLKEDAQAVFYVVGSKPTPSILALNGRNNIVVTGRVDDVRPYIEQTKLSVAPLQIARGIQNKVLEALAMATPVVLSSMAAEGIGKSECADYHVHDDPASMAKQVCDLLAKDNTSRQTNRDFVDSHFSWESEMYKFSDLLNGVSGE